MSTADEIRRLIDDWNHRGRPVLCAECGTPTRRPRGLDPLDVSTCSAACAERARDWRPEPRLQTRTQTPRQPELELHSGPRWPIVEVKPITSREIAQRRGHELIEDWRLT